jgi:hypothetical protein
MSVFKRKNLSLGLLLGILVLSAPSLAFSVPKQQYIGVGLPREFLDLQQKHNQIRSTLFQTEKDFSLRDESWKERMQNFRQEKAKLVMLQSAQRLTEARILEEKLRNDKVSLREEYDLISREKERLREHHKTLHEIRCQIGDLALRYQEKSQF